MARTRQRSCAAGLGVTLVEMIVSIVIAGLVGTMILHVTISSTSANKRATSKVMRAMQARVLMDRICNDLESVPSPNLVGNIGIQGTDGKLDGLDADGILLPKAEADTSGDGKDVQFKFSELAYGLEKISRGKTTFTAVTMQSDDQVDGNIGSPKRTLSAQDSKYQIRLNFRYRANRDLRNAAEWKDQWKEPSLPQAIEVTLEIQDSTSKQPTDPNDTVLLTRIVSPKASVMF